MIKRQTFPTLEYLHECFAIDENSPSGLVWRERPQSHFRRERERNLTNTQYAGKFVGSFKTNRWSVVLQRRNIAVSRIVYMLHHNIEEIPNGLIVDHKDRDPSNNKISNLRLATHQQNMSNKTPHSKTGYPYIKMIRRRNRIVYYLNAPRKSKEKSATFETLEDAKDLSKKISIELHGEFSPYHNGLK